MIRARNAIANACGYPFSSASGAVAFPEVQISATRAGKDNEHVV
jgi:hypothetical protein